MAPTKPKPTFEEANCPLAKPKAGETPVQKQARIQEQQQCLADLKEDVARARRAVSPAYAERRAPALREQYSQQKETLRKIEIPRMESSVKAYFRSLLQPSFKMAIPSAGQELKKTEREKEINKIRGEIVDIELHQEKTLQNADRVIKKANEILAYEWGNTYAVSVLTRMARQRGLKSYADLITLKTMPVLPALRLAVRHHGAMRYEQNSDGTITVTKRKTGKRVPEVPDFFNIIIRPGKVENGVVKNGVIQEVCGHPIDQKSLLAWGPEWKAFQKRISDSEAKFGDADGEMDLAIDEGRDARDILQDSDYHFNAYYSFRLPRQFKEMLELKQQAFGLNKAETDALRILTARLVGHPAKAGDGNTAQFTVAKMKKVPDKMADLKYPEDFMVELKYPEGHASEYDTFAAFALDGAVLRKGVGGKWEEAGDSFAQIYRNRHNIK